MKPLKTIIVLTVILLLAACSIKNDEEIINNNEMIFSSEEVQENKNEIKEEKNDLEEATLDKDIEKNNKKDILNPEIQESYIDEIHSKESFKNSLYNNEDILGIIDSENPIIDIDLDGNGKKEKVEILAEEKNFSIDDEKYDLACENVKIIFVDLNNKDNSVEFIRVNNSLSDAGGFCYEAYAFDGENIIKLFDIGNYEFSWNANAGLVDTHPLIFDYLESDIINEKVIVWYKVENQTVNRYISSKVLNIYGILCRKPAGPWANACVDINTGERLELENKKITIKSIISNKIELEDGRMVQCFNETINPTRVLVEFEDGKMGYLYTYDQR